MTLAETLIKQARKGPLHFALLDPEKQTPKAAGEIAGIVADAGSSAIVVGGSTLLSQQQVDNTILSIKSRTDLPVILFPSRAQFLSKYADAVFFMSLLNSRNLDYVIREPVKGAQFVKDSGLEPISMGYVIVEPGMTAGRVGDADLVKQDDLQAAVQYGLAAQYLGMQFFYLEAGSGAPTPVPDEMIRAVKAIVPIPLIVGGGIRNAHVAGEKARAGADIIITGNALEKEKNLRQTITDIIAAVHGEIIV
jgi:phosphoglycerol geranylgeranyltransferase